VADSIAVSVIQDERGWDAIDGDWDRLHAVSATASAPLDFAWLRRWWRVYRDAFREPSLRIVTVWRASTLVGALPLFVHREGDGPFGVRCLRLLSTGEAEAEETCADYLDLLSRPGDEALCARRMWQAIDAMAWDHLELLDIDERSALLTPNTLPLTARRSSRGCCPVADLSGGFEAYLQRLSPNGRAQSRRLLREGERAGVRFEIVGADAWRQAFDDLIRLHQDRWAGDGKAGVFAASRFVEFHRSLVAQWVPERAVLARLSHASGPLAVLYGFLSRSTFEFYQSGVRFDAAGLRSPGTLCHLLLMRALAERGVTAYDFLRGAAPCKKRLATRENQLSAVEIWRPTLRAVAYRSARLASDTVRAGVRRLPVPLVEAGI
jgi:CelD/BcsL family acetyltransferase involved in cellulose biosynthesis